MKESKKLEFEINLLPVISMLAVCISFLLLSTVWIQIASLDVTQAYGTESLSEQKDKKTLMITFEKTGDVQIEVKNTAGKVFSTTKSLNPNEVENELKLTTSKFTDISSAILRPHADTNYENIIQVMDLTRKNSVKEIGVAPL